MFQRVVLAILLMVSSQVFSAGMSDPAVTQSTISTTICVPNYTKKVRPSTYFTNKVKKDFMRAQGITSNPGDYELDHIIPLALGGAPKDRNNLQLQLWIGVDGAKKKDRLETKLHKMVCDGVLPLATAQYEISTNWQMAFTKYIVK